MKSPVALVLAALLPMAVTVPGCASHRTAPTSFPGQSRRSPAPDSRGALVNVDREEPDALGNHHFLYYATPSGDMMPLFSYTRQVEVLWYQSGELAAMSQSLTNDDGVCLVFDTTTRQLTDTTPQLEASVPGLADLRRRGHCVITATGWTRHGDLQVRINGSAPGGPEIDGLIATIRIARTISR